MGIDCLVTPRCAIGRKLALSLGTAAAVSPQPPSMSPGELSLRDEQVCALPARAVLARLSAAACAMPFCQARPVSRQGRGASAGMPGVVTGVVSRLACGPVVVAFRRAAHSPARS